MQNNELRNNLVKMFNTNRDNTYNEIARLASVSQRETEYRRNGMLNFGAKQMVSFVDLSFYTVGGGGPPTVGS